MGRRHAKARFLPGILVFPGGCLEARDHRPSGFAERFAPAPAGLDAATRRKFKGLVRCALRETWEETGVLVGQPAAAKQANGSTGVWRAFAECGLTPGLEGPRLLARAITPAASPIRFHTRFFLAESDEAVGNRAVHDRAGDGELDGVSWMPTDKALAEDLIDVTRFMLERALSVGASDPAPLFHYRAETRLIDLDGRRLHWEDPLAGRI